MIAVIAGCTGSRDDTDMTVRRADLPNGMIARVRNIEVTRGIQGEAFGLGELCRDGRPSIP
jgi:hypothetical protein